MYNSINKRLNEITLRFDIKDGAPSFYLTLISIIASMALAFLLSKIETQYLFGERWHIVYWLQIVISVLAIIVMWHEYALSAAAFKWVLTYIDSTVPFLFSISLYGLVSSIHNKLETNWLCFLSIYCFLGTLAFSNQYIKAKREPENKYNFNALNKLLFTNILISQSLGIIFLLISIAKAIFLFLYVCDLYFMWAGCIFFLSFIILQHYRWATAFKDCKNLNLNSLDGVVRHLLHAIAKHDNAIEVEDHQKVGILLRESLILLINVMSRQIETPVDMERPQVTNFINWTEVLVNKMWAGRENKELRRYLKNIVEETWLLVNWLIHDRNANKTACSIALNSCQTIIGHFIEILEKERTDKTLECPACK